MEDENCFDMEDEDNREILYYQNYNELIKTKYESGIFGNKFIRINEIKNGLFIRGIEIFDDNSVLYKYPIKQENKNIYFVWFWNMTSEGITFENSKNEVIKNNVESLFNEITYHCYKIGGEKMTSIYKQNEYENKLTYQNERQIYSYKNKNKFLYEMVLIGNKYIILSKVKNEKVIKQIYIFKDGSILYFESPKNYLKNEYEWDEYDGLSYEKVIEMVIKNKIAKTFNEIENIIIR